MKNFLKAEVNGRPLTWRDGCALFGLAFIVFVMLGVIFPFSSQPRYAARRTACLFNLKQIGVATHLYAADNADSAPPYLSTSTALAGPEHLVKALNPFIKNESIWHCPETPRSLRGEVFSGIEGSGMMSYVHPIEYARFVRKTGSFKLTAMPDPANLPYLRDPI